MVDGVVRVSVVLLFVCALQGCVIVPVVEAVKKAGITESDRMALLSGDIKKFNDALAWGRKGEALAFATDTGRRALSDDLRSTGEDFKVVESKIDHVEFSENAYTAEVDITLRYFEVPYYVVKKRKERQKWTFSIASGWKIESREVVQKG